ncbi:dentin sialophosphoprotein-like [Dreissena polymorpha]|uniref:dentin sialophosphoprotein-like n=1 Tax=Dreissena polymorpha TaxID=45954 RepID=UPI0022648213|nr:dentin sialophosphoprotein-like [Dreissena polymorpha]
MCKRCSRPKIMEKLLAMGLVGDRKELYKKRAGKSGARSRRKGCNSDDSGDDDEDVGVPLVPLTEENETAMEDEVFLDFLKRLGIAPPANEQEAFWRIPAGISPAELRNMADGLVLDENGEPVNASKIKMKAPSVSKKQVESSSSDDEDAGNRGNLSTKAGNQSKKSRLRNMAASESDRGVFYGKYGKYHLDKLLKTYFFFSDVVSLRRQKKDNSSNDQDSSHKTQSPAPSSPPKMSASSSQKKRRLKKIVDSSDSDDDVPLRSLTSQQGHMPSSSVVTLNRSDLLEEDDSNSNDVRHTEAGDQSLETESHTSIRKAETGDQSQETESHPFARQKETGNQSQETESHPLLFLSSSDEGSDIEDTKQTENRPASSNSKRSRSSRSGSDSDGSKVTQSKKKMRLESSGSDSESKPEASFPATLYTQGPESDSDLDDHVPLRKAIKKRNAIDSDDD